MPTPDPVMAAALRILRAGLDLKQQEVAARLEICRTTVSHLERARVEVSRERLAKIATDLGASECDVEAAIAAAEVLQRSRSTEEYPGDLNSEQRRVADRAVSEVARDFRMGFRATARAAILAADREEAESLAREILAAPREEQRQRLFGVKGSLVWALCEQLCFASQRAAASSPRRAIELAEMALGLVESAPGCAEWRRELEAFALLYAANARRAANGFRAADVDFAKSRRLVPAESSSVILDFSRRFDLEASLRRDQRRFPEALGLLDKALEAQDLAPASRARLLLKKSFVLEQAEEFEAACACLAEARGPAEAAADLRLAFGVLLNFSVNLLHLGRSEEVEELIPSVRALAIRLAEELDLTRVLWLEGRLFAAQGRRVAARAALAQARTDLLHHGLACDAALVALEEAALDLDDGLFQRVKGTTCGLVGLFAAEEIDREALAAIRLFTEAVQREAATARMARDLAFRLGRELRWLKPASP